MLVLKYLLMILGAGLFGSAGALVVYDVFLSAQLRRLLRRNTTDETDAVAGAPGPLRRSANHRRDRSAAKRICTA